MLYKYFNEVFNDDLYNLLDEDYYIDTVKYYTPAFGDFIIYNYNTLQFDMMNKNRCGKESDKSVIGIAVLTFTNMSVDILMKSFISSEAIVVPPKYIGLESHIPAYLKNMFDRYCSKYLRLSKIDIDSIVYRIPNIAALDYIWKSINELKQSYLLIWDLDKLDSFLNRIYYNGILSTYKGKYYIWKPNINGKREILNINAFDRIEFLPMFTMTYNSLEE